MGQTQSKNDTRSKAASGRSRAEVIHFITLSVVLYAFWLILSGKMEAKYLIIGFVSAVTIALITRSLLILPPDRTGSSWLSLWDLPWARLATYIPWLLWQLVLANVAVAVIALSPSLPLRPQLVRFKKHFPHPVGHFILANSITLTPGTVTVDIEGDDEYLVHCVQPAMAQSLVPAQGEGKMQSKVGALFGTGQELTAVAGEKAAKGL